MSHFFTVVLVKIVNEEGPLEEIDRLLSPYDENIEVEEYTNDEGLPSTYNPKSKWDYWVIGGRWNGEIRNAPRDDGVGFNFGEEFHQLSENIIRVKELDHKLVPFAVVTPDGNWHERGKMGWWAMVRDEKPDDDWENEVMKLIQSHQDCWAIGVDCHI